MADLSEALFTHHQTRLLLRDLDWPTCDACGCGTGVLARATEAGEVYYGSRAVCLECGAVLAVSLDVGNRPEWSAMWSGVDDDFYATRVVSPRALAAARRIAGWPRELWWADVEMRAAMGGGA